MGSKKEVFKFRSVNSMVIAPARTGNERRRSRAVIPVDQTNRGVWSRDMPVGRMLMIVVIKFTAPRIDEIPAKWSLKIVKSTDDPLWAWLRERGGYTVHPVPGPLSIILLVKIKISEGGSNQNLMLFIRGNAISGAPSINGTSQLPNPPIMMGITMKKIIIKAWAVTITL